MCKESVPGDEFHILFKCKHNAIADDRDLFMSNLNNQNVQFSNMGLEHIYLYCLMCHDVSIMQSIGDYFSKVMDIVDTQPIVENKSNVKQWFLSHQ